MMSTATSIRTASEWRPHKDGRQLTRPLRGPELVVNYAEKFNNGNVSTALRNPAKPLRVLIGSLRDRSSS